MPRDKRSERVKHRVNSLPDGSRYLSVKWSKAKEIEEAENNSVSMVASRLYPENSLVQQATTKGRSPFVE